jgi:hypothetical protein
LKKYLFALTLLGAGLALAVPHAFAQDEKPAAKKAAKPTKKAVKKTPAKTAATPVIEGTESDDDGKEPDISSGSHTDYQCALGAELTIYENKGDSKHVALRWGKIVHRMRRVETTTGAERFENRKSGLVWIGIPAKGMLLDAKKGQQLANECKSPDQLAGKMRTANSLDPAPAPAVGSTPAAPVAPAAAPSAAPAPATSPATPAAAPAPAEPPKDAPKS